MLLREEVIGRREILSPLQTALLGAVQSDRVGERMDRSMLKRLLKMLDDLSLYAALSLRLPLCGREFPMFGQLMDFCREQICRAL